MNPQVILQSAKSILVIDYPSRDVPEALARAGFHTVVKSGPGADFSTYTLQGVEVISTKAARPPVAVDIVYAHRPIRELETVVEFAERLAAKVLWLQSGLASEGVKDPKGCWMSFEDSRDAWGMVENTKLTFLTEPYIADVARAIPRSA